ncbi:hypothetical protein ACRAWD_30060 [Caulobacter segnis]
MATAVSPRTAEVQPDGHQQRQLLAGIGGDWPAATAAICLGWVARRPPGDQPVLRAGPAHRQSRRPMTTAYLKLKDTGVTNYEQTIAEFRSPVISSSLPAGPLSGAFGVSHRFMTSRTTSSARDLTVGAELLRALATASRTKGSDTVKEAYAELEAPIVKALPLIEALTVNLSGRVSD